MTVQWGGKSQLIGELRFFYVANPIKKTQRNIQLHTQAYKTEKGDVGPIKLKIICAISTQCPGGLIFILFFVSKWNGNDIALA